MEKAKIAKTVSLVFNPIFTGIGIIFLLARLSPAGTSWQKVFWLTFFLAYFLPLFYFLLLLKQKKISDFDITIREERYGFYVLTFLTILASFVSLYFIFGSNFSFFYLKMLLPFFVFFILTFFYKVSGHLFVNSFFILLLYFYLNKSVIIILGFFLLNLIGWSRIALKKHSFWQVVLGAVLPILIYYLYV